MRISLWPVLVCGWMLAATIGNTVVAAPPADEPSGTVSLADAADESDSPENSPAPTEAIGGLSSYQYNPYQYNPYQQVQYVPDGPGSPENGGFAPVPGTFDPAMTAPNAWPQTSPYAQDPRQETFNSGGLWQYNSNPNTAAKWFLTTEYLYGSGLKPGNHYIGSIQNHDLYWDGQVPGVAGSVGGTFGGPFNTQETSIFGNVFHNGYKSSVGFENADGTGLTISGFLLFENNVNNGLISPHAIVNQEGTLMPMWGIVVDNPNGTGTVLPFDTSFYEKYTQQVLGADADFYLAPFFQRQSFTLKFTFGAKYLDVAEQFYVQGVNSGLAYTLTPGSTSTKEALPYHFIGVNPYSTVIQSSTNNNLVGPQLGVRYDLGGDKFKIWGQTKIAVATDIENMVVAGSNVGSYLVPGPGALIPVTGPDYKSTLPVPSVRNVLNDTHISPIFDTSINVDFPGFAWIPYANKWAIFQNATMRIGFNYVYVSEVARPANIINYAIHDPTVNPSSRTWFEYSAVNFAVIWKF